MEIFMNQETFTQIYTTYYETLLTIVTSHCPQHPSPEDVVQETFCILLQTEQLSEQSILSFLKRTLLIQLAQSQPNIPYDFIYLDTISEQSSDSKDFLTLIQYSKQKELEHTKLERLFDCISMLSPVDQKILALFYFHNKNAKEISSLLSLSHSNVTKHLERRKKRLVTYYNHSL